MGEVTLRSSNAKGSAWMAGLCAAVTLFVAVDPLRLSIIGVDPSFTAKRVKQPLPSQAVFPQDANSRLERATKMAVEYGAMGPESLAFDVSGNGPYTGVADGRILRWMDGGWQEFAHTSSNRTSTTCKPGQAMPHVIKSEHICGRPLGLRFNKKDGDLYVADAYLGLLKVGQQGGEAMRLVTEVEGSHLSFTNDLDIASDGSVYFTDSSSKYQRRNFFLLVLSGDDSGRLLKYNPRSGETSVVLRGLQFPNGVTLSKDESFLVIAESVPGRLLRHWLKGPKAGETEVMAVLPGYPDNVRVNEQGDFWVAMHCRRNLASMISGAFPWLRRALLQLPIPFKHIYHLFNGGPPHGILAKYSSDGEFMDVLEDKSGTVVNFGGALMSPSFITVADMSQAEQLHVCRVLCRHHRSLRLLMCRKLSSYKSAEFPCADLAAIRATTVEITPNKVQ
ncbi:hypothetical protein GOP47_0012710 [Adiantum capillus-veneris]|uniref:Strictosidine synthase conserved region domain-containing protein n=1 Tax=Adiantum capillus-veneris TaxID=13818 RepID=A0A9D4UR68_ADICA|nr:hypothetical protein GOP47_0012710 [Adiantum capillus-veneris]